MTQVSWKRQAGLGVALLVLGSGAYWLEFAHKPKKEKATEAAKKIFALDGTQIASFRIVDSARGAFTFKCVDTAQLCKPGDNSKWEVAEPTKLKADDSNVNAVLTSANQLSSTETIDLSEESAEKRAALLREYRLDPESRKTGRQLEFTTTAGKTMSVFLGDTHPIGDSIFVARSGDDAKVYLIPTFFKSNFDHDLTHWRDKKLLSLTAAQITGFQLDGTKGAVSAERNKDGQWVLKSAGTQEMPGDPEHIDTLLSGTTYLTAKQFVSENKSDAKAKAALQGAKKAPTLVLQQEKEKPITLTLFAKMAAKDKPALYATLSHLDPLYEVEPPAKEKLDKSVKDLRLSKLMTSMERYGFKRVEALGRAIEGEKQQALLDKLSGNRIRDFLTGKAVPPGEDKGVTLTLGDEKEPKKRQLVFWKSGDGLYARDLLAKRKEILSVDPAIRDALPWDASFFAEKPKPVASPAPAPAPAAAPKK